MIDQQQYICNKHRLCRSTSNRNICSINFNIVDHQVAAIQVQSTSTLQIKKQDDSIVSIKSLQSSEFSFVFLLKNFLKSSIFRCIFNSPAVLPPRGLFPLSRALSGQFPSAALNASHPAVRLARLESFLTYQSSRLFQYPCLHTKCAQVTLLYHHTNFNHSVREYV